MPATASPYWHTEAELLAAGCRKVGTAMFVNAEGEWVDAYCRPISGPDFDPFIDLRNEGEAQRLPSDPMPIPGLRANLRPHQKPSPPPPPPSSIPGHVPYGGLFGSGQSRSSVPPPAPEARFSGSVPEQPKKKADHNARCKAYWEKQGYAYYRADWYDARFTAHRDLFGVFDGLAFGVGSGVVGVQVTDSTNASKRVSKIRAWPDLARWVASGNRAVVLAFRKLPSGKYQSAEIPVMPL